MTNEFQILRLHLIFAALCARSRVRIGKEVIRAGAFIQSQTKEKQHFLEIKNKQVINRKSTIRREFVFYNAKRVANVPCVALQADDQTADDQTTLDDLPGGVGQLESTPGVASVAKFSLSNGGHFVISSQREVFEHRVTPVMQLLNLQTRPLSPWRDTSSKSSVT